MYKLVRIPSFSVEKPFSSFSKREAKEYFEWFIQLIPERMDYLQSQVKKDYVEWQLDYSKQSLEVLEKWFLSKVFFRKKDTSEIAAFNSQMDATPLLKNVIPASLYTFTDETVSLCFDVGIYLGEAIKQGNDKFKWTYILKPKGYVNYAEPILLGDQDYKDLNPQRVLEAKLAYAFDNGKIPDTILMELYNYNLNN